MNEIKIVKSENVNLYNPNNMTLQFLYTKSIAMIKLMGLLLKEERILVNPIEVINQEFILQFGIDNFNDLKSYYISVFTLMDVLEFLNKYNIINRNKMYENLN